MGCDIHFYVEKFVAEGKWAQQIDTYQPCWNCDGTALDPSETYCGNCKQGIDEHEKTTTKCFYGPLTLDLKPAPCGYCRDSGKPGMLGQPFYSGRNYDLFAKLSGVRGDPVDGFTIENRGLPSDVSEQIKKASDDYGRDGHNHGYYSVAELRETDWSEFPDFEDSIKQMEALDPNPENVRCVFWYDN